MYVACTRARQRLELYAPATIYNRAERGSLHAAQSPFVRELAPGLTEAWVEGFGGRLARRGAGAGGFPPRAGAAGGKPVSRPAPQPEEDCQLPPEEWPRPGAPVSGAPGGAGTPDGPLCHCRHRIFGRGKIVRRIAPDKAQVNFPGFGLKVILTDYLIMED